jgi:hypothetical protein
MDSTFRRHGSVIADPGSCAFLTPGSGVGFFRIPDRKPIFLGRKFYNSLKMGLIFFLQHSKNKIISSFVKFIATKKCMTTNFFPPLSFIAVFGSEIRDPGWAKIRIREKHPGSATLNK